MSREWQQTKFEEYVMPDAVYYQCLWAVRDLSRMEKKLKEVKADIQVGVKGRSMVSDGKINYDQCKPTEKNAIESVMLEERIKGIRNALGIVPNKYRTIILTNIIFKEPGTKFPDKHWRFWKQRFLYNVAKNLALL